MRTLACLVAAGMLALSASVAGAGSGIACVLYSVMGAAMESGSARPDQPWRCLWRGFSQMTRTEPWRRITLHFSHIFLTDGRTFIGRSLSLVAVGDAAPAEVVGGELDLHAVTGQDPDVVHPHLPGDVREHLVPVLELDPEHGVREWLDDRSLENDRVFLGLSQRATSG